MASLLTEEGLFEDTVEENDGESLLSVHGTVSRSYVAEDGGGDDTDEDVNTSSESDVESNSDYQLVGTDEEFSDFMSASQSVEDQTIRTVTARGETGGEEEEELPERAAQADANKQNKSCSIPPLSQDKIDLIKSSMQNMQLKPPSPGAAMTADKLARCKVRIGDEITSPGFLANFESQSTP